MLGHELLLKGIVVFVVVAAAVVVVLVLLLLLLLLLYDSQKSTYLSDLKFLQPPAGVL